MTEAQRAEAEEEIRRATELLRMAVAKNLAGSSLLGTAVDYADNCLKMSIAALRYMVDEES